MASHIMLGGLVASRFGLWLFDLAVFQMLQDWVLAQDIGTVPTKAVKALAIPCDLWPACRACTQLAMCMAWH